MDPISAVGIALSVAGLAGQLFTGCIQCIQFITTAKDMPKDCMHLNLSLRLEQQRLFSWSEACGLLDYDVESNQKVLESNAFGLHRSTVLELLVQMKVLFEDFEKLQIRHKRLVVSKDVSEPPPTYEKSQGLDSANDTSESLVPLAPKRKSFIDKAINAIKSTPKGGTKRLRWAAFDKDEFELLLQKFSSLNDSMTALLDMRLQDEIYSATQDTNRAVLQMHHDLADLTSLVKATLVLTLEKQGLKAPASQSLRGAEKGSTAGLELLAQLARFKAFNESIETESTLDAATVKLLKLGNPGAAKVAMEIDRSCITVTSTHTSQGTESRCEAIYKQKGRFQRVWIEWKDYEITPRDSRPGPLVIERAQKLAALLHHRPKPKHFRVPHCLGYFDNAVHFSSEDGSSPIEEDNEYRIGFIFEKPEDVIQEAPPISLLHLLQTSPKPRVTDRVALAKAIANCILYLHSVNWLHKGLRSHNIVFFRSESSPDKIEYSEPYISGFDFARPARPGEPTELPKDNIEYNLYRHPSTQNEGLGPRESYRKSFDIYSLGVVLVELAHWKPIDTVLGIDIKSAKPRPRVAAGVREMLLQEEQVQAAGANMGEVYEKLVEKCLRGGEMLGISTEKGEDETRDRAVAAKLSMVFYEEVVRKLDEIRV